MKVLSYSGESVVTTDGVGNAVLDYTRALIADNSADVVDIPVVLDEQERMASIVLGPGSPLLVMPSARQDTELRDELTIARLYAKIAALVPHQVVPLDAVQDTNDLLYDL
ncbi:MAG TPA: hypothetical protein VGF80_04915 [Galbitalea sp.]|jgi:hypothetical protein